MTFKQETLKAGALLIRMAELKGKISSVRLDAGKTNSEWLLQYFVEE